MLKSLFPKLLSNCVWKSLSECKRENGTHINHEMPTLQRLNANQHPTENKNLPLLQQTCQPKNSAKNRAGTHCHGSLRDTQTIKSQPRLQPTVALATMPQQFTGLAYIQR